MRLGFRVSWAEGKKKALGALFLMLIAFFLYYPALENTFHRLDDDSYITGNEKVVRGLTTENIKWAFSTTYFGFYYPVTWLSHMTDVQFFGLGARGHHFTNLLIHSLNCALLFLALSGATRRIWSSMAVATLFAIHPMNVETVAWLAERKNLLATFFLLLSFILYYLSVKKGKGFTVLLYLCFILGLMAKSSIIIFPFLILLCDFWPLGRISFSDDKKSFRGTLKRLVIEKLPLLVPAIISGLLTIHAQTELKAISSLEAIPMTERMAGMFLSLKFYLVKLFAPVDLCAYYPHHKGGYSIAGVFVGLVLSSALTWMSWKKRREHPSYFVGWWFFLFSLLPVIGIIQVGGQAYADRYVYFAYWGLFAIIVFAVPWDSLARRGSWRKLALGAAFFGICLWLFILSRAQIRTWKDDVALYSRISAISSDSAFGFYNLGLLYLDRNEPEKANDLLIKASEKMPESGTIRYFTGESYLRLGDGRRAREEYEKALKLGFNAEMAKEGINRAKALIPDDHSQ